MTTGSLPVVIHFCDLRNLKFKKVTGVSWNICKVNVVVSLEVSKWPKGRVTYYFRH